MDKSVIKTNIQLFDFIILYMAFFIQNNQKIK